MAARALVGLRLQLQRLGLLEIVPNPLAVECTADDQHFLSGRKAWCDLACHIVFAQQGMRFGVDLVLAHLAAE